MVKYLKQKCWHYWDWKSNAEISRSAAIGWMDLLGGLPTV
jgi:hypothetical protein